jgi:hypothetical protein
MLKRVTRTITNLKTRLEEDGDLAGKEVLVSEVVAVVAVWDDRILSEEEINLQMRLSLKLKKLIILSLSKCVYDYQSIMFRQAQHDR